MDYRPRTTDVRHIIKSLASGKLVLEPTGDGRRFPQEVLGFITNLLSGRPLGTLILHEEEPAVRTTVIDGHKRLEIIARVFVPKLFPDGGWQLKMLPFDSTVGGITDDGYPDVCAIPLHAVSDTFSFLEWEAQVRDRAHVDRIVPAIDHGHDIVRRVFDARIHTYTAYGVPEQGELEQVRAAANFRLY